LSVPETKTIRAVCPHDCPDTCGMLVTVSKVGRRLCAAIRIILSPKVSLSKVLSLSGPGLSRGSFAMADEARGPKGKGQFTRITWDEAIDTIARRFQEIAASADGPQAILPIVTPARWGN